MIAWAINYALLSEKMPGRSNPGLLLTLADPEQALKPFPALLFLGRKAVCDTSLMDRSTAKVDQAILLICQPLVKSIDSEVMVYKSESSGVISDSNPVNLLP